MRFPESFTPAERFKYLYNEHELEAWAPRLQELADEADEVHALMNNCYQDYGVKNAADLQAVFRMGCDIGQGYLLAHPLPKARFISMLRQRVRPKPAPEQVAGEISRARATA